MADVKVKVSAETGQSAQQVDAVANSLSGLQTEAQGASAATQAGGVHLETMGRTAQDGAGKLAGMAGAVASLSSMLGTPNSGAGMVASVAGATAQFAAMGSMLGPAGTVVGGLAGLVVSLRAVVTANNDVEASSRRAREAIETLAARRISDRDRASFDAEIGGGAISGARSEADIELAAESRRVRREELRREAEDIRRRTDEARRAFEGAGRDLPEATARRLQADFNRVRDESRGLLREIATLDGEIERRGAAARERERAAAAEGSSGGGGGGARTGPSQRGDEQGTGDPFDDRSTTDQTSRLEELATERLRIIEDTLAKEARLRDEALEEERKRGDEELAMWQRQAAEMERMGAEQEAQRIASDEAALESREQTAVELTGLLGQTTAAFGKALGQIILGEKTAEEAFKGLAVAFLEMISQYATLKAATEFAEAGAAAARYDWGGFATHVAAGVAFTAVAVATGVGAAAIGSPPAAPARPEAAPSAQGSGGGDTVINWNSPVITAGTYAELGREVENMRAAAGSI